jgi:hypothetical protein
MRFIEGTDELSKKSIKEKAFLWLALEMNNKDLENLVELMRINSEISESYNEDSYFKKDYLTLKSTLKKLCEIPYRI